MSAGRVLLAGLLALALAIGASSTAAAGVGYRLDLIAGNYPVVVPGWSSSFGYPHLPVSSSGAGLGFLSDQLADR